MRLRAFEAEQAAQERAYQLEQQKLAEARRAAAQAATPTLQDKYYEYLMNQGKGQADTGAPLVVGSGNSGSLFPSLSNTPGLTQVGGQSWSNPISNRFSSFAKAVRR
jgi:hypothetical protein